MDPGFVTRGALRVRGVEDDACKIEKVDPGFHDLWMNRYMARHDSVKSHSTDGAHYGVWFGATRTDMGGGVYLAGMAVRDSATVPDGWVIRGVPAATYAVFETTLRDIGEATEHAPNCWLPQSEYELDTPKPRFDFMPPGTTGQKSPVSVRIPVRRKG